MSEVKVDTISERTAAGGVTIDGVLVKDGVATFQTAAGSPLVFEGATADAFETTFAITDPTADRTITFPDSSFTVPTAGGLFSAYALLEDQKGAGNNGQSLSITTWNHRDLNTEVYDGIGITIASNRFEVPIGTYLIKWSAPAFRANRHQTRLYDYTNSAVVAGGSSEYSIEMYRGDQTRSFGAARVVCSAATNYQIDHYVYTAGGGGEYGTMTCTYTQVEVYKES